MEFKAAPGQAAKVKKVVTGTYNAVIDSKEEKPQFNKFKMVVRITDPGPWEYGGKVYANYDLNREGAQNALAAVIRAITGDWENETVSTKVIEVGMPIKVHVQRVTVGDNEYVNVRRVEPIDTNESEDDSLEVDGLLDF